MLMGANGVHVEEDARVAPVITFICLNVEMYLPKLQNVFGYSQEMLVGANGVHVEEDARVAPCTCYKMYLS